MSAQTTEQSLIFTAESIRAILAGTKTVTRRVVKPQPKSNLARLGEWGTRATDWIINQTAKGRFVFNPDPDGPTNGTARNEPLLQSIACPKGKLGDMLWVRETFYCDDYRFPGGPSDEMREALFYRADHDHQCACFEAEQPKWKPSIFMPRWASRITLEIVSVRVERLQSITDDDVEAEGLGFHIPECRYFGTSQSGYRHVYDSNGVSVDGEPICDCGDYSYHEMFAAGWNEINGKRGFTWDSNPWVWRIEFRRVT